MQLKLSSSEQDRVLTYLNNTYHPSSSEELICNFKIYPENGIYGLNDHYLQLVARYQNNSSFLFNYTERTVTSQNSNSQTKLHGIVSGCESVLSSIADQYREYRLSGQIITEEFYDEDWVKKHNCYEPLKQLLSSLGVPKLTKLSQFRWNNYITDEKLAPTHTRSYTEYSYGIARFACIKRPKAHELPHTTKIPKTGISLVSFHSKAKPLPQRKNPESPIASLPIKNSLVPVVSCQAGKLTPLKSLDTFLQSIQPVLNSGNVLPSTSPKSIAVHEKKVNPPSFYEKSHRSRKLQERIKLCRNPWDCPARGLMSQ